MLVHGGSLNQFCEVDKTLLSMDHVHHDHGAQLLYTVVNRKPVKMSEGVSDVIA